MVDFEHEGHKYTAHKDGSYWRWDGAPELPPEVLKPWIRKARREFEAEVMREIREILAEEAADAESADGV